MLFVFPDGREFSLTLAVLLVSVIIAVIFGILIYLILQQIENPIEGQKNQKDSLLFCSGVLALSVIVAVATSISYLVSDSGNFSSEGKMYYISQENLSTALPEFEEIEGHNFAAFSGLLGNKLSITWTERKREGLGVLQGYLRPAPAGITLIEANGTKWKNCDINLSNPRVEEEKTIMDMDVLCDPEPIPGKVDPKITERNAE